jgi:hypothetical protein
MIAPQIFSFAAAKPLPLALLSKGNITHLTPEINVYRMAGLRPLGAQIRINDGSMSAENWGRI